MHMLQQDRQCNIRVQRSIELRSCNNCCHWKEKSITYSECVFVVLGIQDAM
jgi:hypothetical protein